MRLTRSHLVAAAVLIAAGTALGQPPGRGPRGPGMGPRATQPDAFAKDQDLWRELLLDHTKVRRTVMHLDNGVQTITESDDPEVAAKIAEHARSMQARMESGGRVRIWDPVFADLFEKADAVKIQITPTERGVQIVETSDDPEAAALIRSHALAISRFVREGYKAAPRESLRFSRSDPVPAPELCIGGVPHRFILTQPDPGQLEALKAAGVDTVVNFRHASEHEGYDEQAAAQGAGLAYCNLPYNGVQELTDDLIDSTRAALREADEKKGVLALHCRTGNRIGPGWAAYRALDRRVPLEQAIAEARAMQMKDPAYEARAREYIQKRLEPSPDRAEMPG